MNEILSTLKASESVKNAGSIFESNGLFEGKNFEKEIVPESFFPERNDFPSSIFLENPDINSYNPERQSLSDFLEKYFRKEDVFLSEISQNVYLKDFIPREHGGWKGEPGNSSWYPDEEHVPNGGRDSNPDGKTWGEILNENGIDHIEFHEGEPDFSKISKGTVEINGFSDTRESNYAKADQKLADQWNQEGKAGRTDWTKEDVEAYRKGNNLTWHERSDMKTMDLVPTIVHANVPHAGGISEIKKQNESG